MNRIAVPTTDIMQLKQVRKLSRGYLREFDKPSKRLDVAEKSRVSGGGPLLLRAIMFIKARSHSTWRGGHH